MEIVPKYIYIYTPLKVYIYIHHSTVQKARQVVTSVP